MRLLKVVDTLKIGENTLICVNDSCDNIKNGSELLDENGKTYEVLSISTGNNLNITNILIRGNFNSKKILV